MAMYKCSKCGKTSSGRPSTGCKGGSKDKHSWKLVSNKK